MKDLNNKCKLLFTCLTSILIISCSGSSSTPIAGGGSCSVTAGLLTTSSYTISWNAVDPTDLTGYKIYYGTNSPLTKYNALGSVSVGNTTSVTFTPGNYNITTCAQAIVGVTSVGTRPESALSDTQIITVE